MNEAISIEEVYSKAYITREGSFSRAGLEFVDEAEIFEGNENKITLAQVYSKAFVTREGNFKRAGLESIDEAEIFEGYENKLTLAQIYSKRFHCNYLLHDFPFDTQVT